MKRRSRAAGLALLGAALALAACAGPRHWLPAPADDPALRARLAEALSGRYPPQFRLVQRLALHAAGKQYDMMGYLVVSAPDTLRAVALGEMGGRLFDLSLDRGAPAVLKKPDRMPPRPLVEGVLEDLRHLVLPLPGPALRAARGADGAPALVGGEAGGRAVEYTFDAEGRHLTGSLESEGGRPTRRVAYADYRRFEGAGGEIPGRVVVENRRWHYTLEVHALEFLPGPPPAAAEPED